MSTGIVGDLTRADWPRPRLFDDIWFVVHLPDFHDSAALRARCLEYAIRTAQPRALFVLLALGAEPNGLPLAYPLKYSDYLPDVSVVSPLGLALRMRSLCEFGSPPHPELGEKHSRMARMLVEFGASLELPHDANSIYISAHDYMLALHPDLAGPLCALADARAIQPTVGSHSENSIAPRRL